MKGTKKYPSALLEQLLEHVNDHPGCSVHDLIPIANSYFSAWANHDSIMHRALIMYINGALKRLGAEKNRRDILSYFEMEDGKKHRKHAVVPTVASLDILFAQREAVMQQLRGLQRDVAWLDQAIEFKLYRDQTIGMLQNGEIVERMTSE